jgi:hypothetical protein
VFIFEYYFTSKSFDAVREAFSNAYPDKDVPNKTTIHRLVTKFRWTFVFENVVGIFSICCKAILTNQNSIKKTRFSGYINVTKVYKYCCS